MLTIEILRDYKSIPAGSSFNLPNFSVLTGANGSGKTQFLEALADPKLANITASGSRLNYIHLSKFAELADTKTDRHNPEKLEEHDNEVWREIQSLKSNFGKLEIISPENPPELLLEEFLKRNANSFALSTIKAAAERGVSLLHLERSDVAKCNPGYIPNRDKNLFAANLAEVFNTYRIRHTENEFKNHFFKKGSVKEPGLDEEEFLRIFGPEPWSLMNEILRTANLTYRISPPAVTYPKNSYTLRLTDTQKELDISVNELSTGEKVLMGLGLAIYRIGGDAGKSDLLLLDEPDAPLHPEYSQTLVRVLREIIERIGVRIVLTTHSPSTLAICPEDSIFQISRGTGRPTKISRSEAVRNLTKGIPHFRVSTEERRQIFVESKFDVSYYERIFNTLHIIEPFKFEPVFIQPHSGSSNCTDVIEIVNRLSGAGNDLVRGVIDWDGENLDRNKVYVLGGGKRDAIENYILDPLFIALCLIRANKRTFSEFGVDNKPGYLQTNMLSEDEAQKIADNILLQAGVAKNEMTRTPLLNGWNAKRPREFLEMDGHDWEDRLVDTIPELSELIRGKTGDDKLKKHVLYVIEDTPLFLPVEVRDTLEKLE